MRTIDLLALTIDLDKKAGVQADVDGNIMNVRAVQVTRDETVELVCADPSKHALRHWELAVLLNQPSREQLPVRLRADAKSLPIFGCKFRDGNIILH